MEELYVNKNGFKCVRSQLAKTDGLDPVEHAQLTARFRDNPAALQAELGKLRVAAKEYSNAQ